MEASSEDVQEVAVDAECNTSDEEIWATEVQRGLRDAIQVK